MNTSGAKLTRVTASAGGGSQAISATVRHASAHARHASAHRRQWSCACVPHSAAQASQTEAQSRQTSVSNSDRRLMNAAASQQRAAQSLSSRTHFAIACTSGSARQAVAQCSHAWAHRTQASRHDWYCWWDIVSSSSVRNAGEWVETDNPATHVPGYGITVPLRPEAQFFHSLAFPFGRVAMRRPEPRARSSPASTPNPSPTRSTPCDTSLREPRSQRPWLSPPERPRPSTRAATPPPTRPTGRSVTAITPPPTSLPRTESTADTTSRPAWDSGFIPARATVPPSASTPPRLTTPCTRSYPVTRTVTTATTESTTDRFRVTGHAEPGHAPGSFALCVKRVG